MMFPYYSIAGMCTTILTILEVRPYNVPNSDVQISPAIIDIKKTQDKY